MFKKNINIIKRISAFLLALIMLLGALPLNVFAEAMHRNNDSAIVESNTTEKEKPSIEPKGTDPEKHTISFNSNGGSGDMKSVEVENGEEYSLPKNKFKAPEGKEFKSWLMDKEELKEGHRLVVTKDVELKANWKDIKVNPVKKALNSLIGKEDKEELDVSKELVGEAVTNDGEYTGPAHNSVVSSDGKVQIRNFEVFWTSTEGDTITFDNAWPNEWYKYSNWIPYYTYSGGERPEKDKNYSTHKHFSSEPKMQINWALSGEKTYSKGDMKIDLPLFAYNNDKDFSFKIMGSPIPKVVFNEDGTINYNANYGNATLAYYYDEDSKSTKITNILDLAPGASGTLTLTYGFDGNVRFIKDSEVAAIQPTLTLKHNDEVLKTKDKELKVEIKTKFDARLLKSGTAYKSWQDEWGNDIKPENADDYIYVKYKIEPQIDDTLQTNLDIKLTDVLGEVYNRGKKVDVEQEIIAYSDIDSNKLTNIPTKQGRIEFPVYNLNIGKNENKKDYEGNRAIYREIAYGGIKLHPAYKTIKTSVLVKIPKDKLGFTGKKEDSYSYEFKNNAEIEVSPNNSNQDKVIKNASCAVSLKYTYVPDVEFNAPPGDMFVLQKQAKHTHAEYKNGWDWIKGPRDGFHIDNGRNIYLSGTDDNRDNPFRDIWNEYKPYEELYSDRDVSWKIIGKARVANATYDSKYDDPENPSNAYGRKKVKYELVDDYLYLADDYTKELTPEDYTVKSIEFSDSDKFIYKYDYEQPSKKAKADYMENVDTIAIPASLYIRKTSTSEWEKAASFDMKTLSSIKIENFESFIKGVKKDDSYWGGEIFLPEGYTSTKLVYETPFASINLQYKINGTLHPSKRVKDYIDKSKDDEYVMNIKLRNDSTFLAYDEEGNKLGLQGTTKSSTNVDRTLELDRINYGEEMYHSPVQLYLRQKHMPKISRQQFLSKNISETKNDSFKKAFIVSTSVRYYERFNNADLFNYTENEVYKVFHHQNSGTFYDLLPFGVTGVSNVSVRSGRGEYNQEYNYLLYKDKDTNSTILKSSYELIPNWRNSGRTMLIAKFDNAYLEKKMNSINHNIWGGYNPNANIKLYYDMIYPWDSYKDYGSKINRNLVAYESGFEKRPDDGLDDSLTNELENGYKDTNPGFYKTYNGDTKKYDKDTKLFTNQEIEWMKDLNPNHDEKRFLYAQASTTVSGDTEANVGLTKHVSTDINPNFTLKSSTKEGGNYQYKIRLQAAHGTSVSNLVFFDSIENYNPLKADEDYGIKQWRGKLSSIDLTHPIMKGIAPKVYVSTKPKLDIEKHNDVSDSTIWKLYKEGDDLSNVQAVAIDLRKNKDGSDFKLEQDTAINVYLNMKAPWNLKEKQIDPKAKALNAIYASNTVTTSLDNKSTKLIYTAYTAVDLKPVTTETQIKATKKHLDKEGKDIALKGKDFTFELKDAEGKVLQTKTNDNKGNITFDPIKYNSWDVGEHTYKIVEVKGDSETTAYDNHEEIIKVKVERSGDSELKATITYDKDGAAFNNHEVDAITASLEAKKVYIGKGGLEEKPKAGAFEFILKDAEGKEVTKANNDAEGKVVFEGLEFKPNQIGEHKYTIEEVKGNNPAIEYDSTKKNVTVNVSLTKDFKLKAYVVYEGEKIPTFTNTLKSASLQLVKLKDGTDPFILDEVKDKNGILTSYKVPEAQKDNVLDGAEYELYKLTEGKEELIATLTTKNGISQVVQDIMPGKYKLKETKAPKGYTLNDKDLIFDITDKDAGTIVAKFATDDSIIDMPSTGGQGTKALMIGGGILVAIMAGVLVVANKKKKEELNK